MPFARGLLTIDPVDFLTQMRTLKGRGGANLIDRLGAVARFGAMFAGALYDVYGGVFAPGQRFDPATARKKRQLRVGAPEVHSFRTKDGKTLRLTRYKGGDKGPLIFSHGLGVSSLIFSLDTIDTNLLEFFYGGRIRLLASRLSGQRGPVLLPRAVDRRRRGRLTTIPPPSARCAKSRDAPSVQMLVHCFGSTTFFMAMLRGLEGVRSAVVSQIATDVIVPWWPQRLLAELRDAVAVRRGRASTSSTPGRPSPKGLPSKLVDAALWPTLLLTGRHPANSATSNRITALYGQLYEYEQLNQATMDERAAADVRRGQHLGVQAARAHRPDRAYRGRRWRRALSAQLSAG